MLLIFQYEIKTSEMERNLVRFGKITTQEVKKREFSCIKSESGNGCRPKAVASLPA